MDIRKEIHPIDVAATEILLDCLGGISGQHHSGSNYFIDVQAGGSTDGIGSAIIQPNVLAVEWGPDISGNLFLDVLVKNLAYALSAELSSCEYAAAN